MENQIHLSIVSVLNTIWNHAVNQSLDYDDKNLTLGFPEGYVHVSHPDLDATHNALVSWLIYNRQSLTSYKRSLLADLPVTDTEIHQLLLLMFSRRYDPNRQGTTHSVSYDDNETEITFTINFKLQDSFDTAKAQYVKLTPHVRDDDRTLYVTFKYNEIPDLLSLITILKDISTKHSYETLWLAFCRENTIDVDLIPTLELVFECNGLGEHNTCYTDWVPNYECLGDGKIRCVNAVLGAMLNDIVEEHKLTQYVTFSVLHHPDKMVLTSDIDVVGLLKESVDNAMAMFEEMRSAAYQIVQPETPAMFPVTRPPWNDKLDRGGVWSLIAHAMDVTGKLWITSLSDRALTNYLGQGGWRLNYEYKIINGCYYVAMTDILNQK